MLHSLRWRLLFGAALLIAVALGAAALLFGRFTTSRFEEFVELDRSRQNQRFQALLEGHVRRAEGFAQVGPLLEQIASLGARRMLLVETGGDWHVAPAGTLAGAEVTSGEDGEVRIQRRSRSPGRVAAEGIVLKGGIPIHAPSGAVAGRLYPLPDVPVRHPGPAAPGRNFVGSMNRSLLVAAAIAGLVALAATWLLSRRIVGPVEALTEAVRAMAAGRRDARVSATGRDEIGALGRAFNAMADRLAHTERLRKDLVNDVAHELRTPLTNLRGQIEALQDGVTSADAATLASLHEDALLLQRLVEDLQDLALAEAGQLPLHFESRDLGREVEGVVAGAAARAHSAGVSLVTAIAAGLPPARLDPARFRQILTNLLANALRHTPKGGQVEVAARHAGDRLEIVVSDTGTGIAPEHLPRIFDRFYRTDPSRARDTGGAGLGLAIARQLAEAHGGSLTVHSVAGRGAAFTLVLPPAS